MLDNPLGVNLLARYLPPDAIYWLGTDNLGRDLWIRCFQGALTNLQISIGTVLCSGLIVPTMVAISRIYPRLNVLMHLIIDVILSMPRLLLLILTCFTFGGGKNGVIMAVALTHQLRLALILRVEAQRVAHGDYLTLTWRLGYGHFYRWRHHCLSALLPQWLMEVLLMFPHAVSHNTALGFLSFGLTPHEPSPDLLLADMLRFISRGDWWLVLFPKLVPLSLMMSFD